MVLTCVGITKAFGIEEVLGGISFNLEMKEKAAIVGVNGAGKTTLFKIIAGEMAADDGQAIIQKGMSLGYLPQNYESDSANTLEDELLTVFFREINMEKEMRSIEKEMGGLTGDALDRAMERYSQLMANFEQNGGYEYRSRIRGVIKGLGFSEDESIRKISTFSGGQKTRVSLGKILLRGPDVLLLDEPTNHLDIESIQWLEDFIKSYSGTVLLISHDRYFIDKTVTKIIEIENKKSAVYNGNYTVYAKKKETDRQIALKHYLDQQKEIKRQEEIIKTLRSYNTEKSIKRAESREKLLDKMEKAEAPENLPETMRLILKPKIESGNDVLYIDNLKMAFGKNLLFENLSFDIKKAEKTALIGANGIGKTTLLKIINSELTPLAGHVIYGINVKKGYYDQERQNISPEKTIFQEIADSYPRLRNGEIRNMLAAMAFTGDEVFKVISDLSGGEKGRVALAKIMLGSSNFLILDEPTNHLDMFSKEVLEDAVRNYTGTVLYISHDRYFINNTAEKILELTKDGINIYYGNYDYYLEKKSEEQPSLVPKSHLADTSGDVKSSWQVKKEAESEERKRKTLAEKLEKEITATERKLEEVNHRLTLEHVCTDQHAVQEAYDEKMSLEEILLNLYKEWGSAVGG